MAGAGYKLFNTGDVLTAAQVNTYLMEQSVMVFADAAARTTALSGVVAEGMLSYLKDTNAVEVYNGSAWVASDDPNAIQNTIVDAKGDLIAASANDTPARLAVGNDGETLVADSSASTGLRWQGNFAAGKNKVINGDFNINQRGFTSTTTTATFGFDRWRCDLVGGTVTYSAQTFTPGTAPVAGYESKNYLRVVVSGQSAAGDLAAFLQRIEDVRTFAGQTVTVSFWAKASADGLKVALELRQLFGAGGSADNNKYIGQSTLSTSWARYSITTTLDSLSGKTIGGDTNNVTLNVWTSAGSTYAARTGTLGTQSGTFEFWGFQVEAGSVATAFQTATGTLAGELAACQRYFQVVGGNTGDEDMGAGQVYSTTNAIIHLEWKVPFRAAPTVAFGTGGAATDFAVYNATGTALTLTSILATSSISKNSARTIPVVASGLVAGNATLMISLNSNGRYFVSAEL